jgi:hypothetical protein
MTQWRRHAFVPIVFALAATVLVHASQGNAQTALPLAKVSGAWDTTWGGGEAVLKLTQTGAAVTGTYSGTNEGTVKGTITGNALAGKWAGSASDSGGFVLKFSADGKSFEGAWGFGGSKTDGGPWMGKRK